jgi:HPt (histidine-containing phosphotransfer) domain-containing protein
MAAHTLKGSTAVLGAEPAQEVAAVIEELARQRDWVGAREALARLEAELERLKPALRALETGG